MDLILNHIISFTKAKSIDSYLKKWKKAGFVVGKKTVRHEPGLRNGFVYFGPEYIEFSWVEDETLFQKEAKAYQKSIRHNPSPYGIAFESSDVNVLHRRLRRAGYNVPETYSKGPRDADASVIWWSFQSIPFRYLPGAWTFALTYELRKNQRKARKLTIGRNTLFAVAGLTFVTKYPRQRVSTWKKFLATSTLKKITTDRYQLIFGPHRLEWMTPNAYEEEYGLKIEMRRGHQEIRELTLIHLFAESLLKAKLILRKNKFNVRSDKDRLLIGPQKNDGFCFSVTEKKVKNWLQERSQFGQRFTLK